MPSESVSTLFLHVGKIIKLQIDSNEIVCLIIKNVEQYGDRSYITLLTE